MFDDKEVMPMEVVEKALETVSNDIVKRCAAEGMRRLRDEDIVRNGVD